MVSRRIMGFDGLRALAVLLVYANHKTEIGAAVGPGGFGVRLFFVLSGYLIIGILHEQRRKVESQDLDFRSAIAKFYANRLFRIWPVYFTVATVVYALQPLKTDQILSLLTFTVNLFIAHVWGEYPAKFGPLWSVAVEEQFYLWIAPVLLLTPARHARTVCLVTIALACLWGATWLLMSLPARAVYVGSISNFGLMALGGWTVLSGRQPVWLTRTAPVLLIAYLVLPFGIWLSGNIPYLTNVLLWSTPIFIAVVLKAIASEQNSLMVKCLDVAPLRHLGMISYGFYMYHSLIPARFIYSLGFGNFAIVADFLSVLAVSVLSWFLLEKPLQTFRDGLFQQGIFGPITISGPSLTRLSAARRSRFVSPQKPESEPQCADANGQLTVEEYGSSRSVAQPAWPVCGRALEALRALALHPRGVRLTAHITSMPELIELGYVEQRQARWDGAKKGDMGRFITPAGRELLDVLRWSDRE